MEPMQVDLMPINRGGAAAAAQAALEDNDNNPEAAASGVPRRGGGGGPSGGGGGPGAVGDDRGDEGASWTVDNPTLDLESYAQGYTGLARLTRLSFVATHCPPLRVEALRLALLAVVGTHNTALYVSLHKRLAEAVGASGGGTGAGPSSNLPDLAAGSPAAAGSGGVVQSPALPQFDQAWVEQRAKKAALKLEKLDTDLKNYKSNSIKESIRRGYDDLGDHYLDCGDLQNALKAYSRSRDYCTSGKHVVNMCLNVIKVSVQLQNWSHVISYVNKAMATPDFAATEPGGGGGGAGVNAAANANKSSDANVLLTRLRCASGLAELATRKYKNAAKHFLAANVDHCDIPDMMSTQNVATYGGLCALSTFDRTELQKMVISSSSFKLFLELDPQLREVIFSFHESKYGRCLRLLEEMRENFLLDPYLAPHVRQLYGLIRSRGLVQYFSPYLSADMRTMAERFNTTVAALEDEVSWLILDGQVQARIDSHNKVLYAQDVDQRSTTFEKALEMGEQYQRRAKLMILRSALLKNNVLVKTVHRGPGASAASGGGAQGEQQQGEQG